LLSAVTVFEFLVIQVVQSLQGDEGRLGKKASQRALKMAEWHSVCEIEASRMGSH